MERIPYVIIGDVAVINVKTDEEAQNAETLRKAREIMRRHPRLRAVYAKVETVGHFRVQRLIHVLGERVERVWHRENQLWFRVTLGRVYFNPRLATEHLEAAKLLDSLGARRVLDMFSGVGGYAITIAAYAASPRLIHANDANPHAVSDMLASLYRNRKRIQGKMLLVTCMDAHMLPMAATRHAYDAIIMDYPQASEAFLREAAELAADTAVILVYRVLHEGEEEGFLRNIVDELGAYGLQCSSIGTRPVLDYAPRKYVYRFTLICRRI